MAVSSQVAAVTAAVQALTAGVGGLKTATDTLIAAYEKAKAGGFSQEDTDALGAAVTGIQDATLQVAGEVTAETQA